MYCFYLTILFRIVFIFKKYILHIPILIPIVIPRCWKQRAGPSL